MTTVNGMDLIGGREIQELLGVSRQRAHVLMNRDDFPAPAATVNRRNRVWDRETVVAWIAEHGYDIIPAPKS